MKFEEYFDSLKEKTVAVIGIGVSNRPLIELLLSRGIYVTACDKKERAALGELAEHLEVDNRSIHAFIVGEHGDSEIAAWSSANVSGIELNQFCEMRGHFEHEKAMWEIAEKVRNSAYEIIEKKQATYYGIAMAVKRICEVIMRDEKSILPVSSMMHGAYGIDDVVLSMPVILGKNGIESRVPILLNEEETQKLQGSAEVLKNILEECEI